MKTCRMNQKLLAKMVPKVSRTAKLCISLIVLVVDVLVGWVCHLFGKTTQNTCVILYYHSIRSQDVPRFAKQMDLLVRLTTPISLTDSPTGSTTRYSSVTFDDAFENVFENALPELTKRGIPAAVFVTTKFLGKPASWWPPNAPESAQKLVSAERLKSLRSNLITLGSHTHTHPMLPLLDETHARQELQESKSELERILEREIRLFSFPFGALNEKLVQWCLEAGYKRIFGGQSLPTHTNDDSRPFLCGRIGVFPADSYLEFRLKALGAYRWLPCAVAMKRWILSSRFIGRAYALLPRRAES